MDHELHRLLAALNRLEESWEDDIGKHFFANYINDFAFSGDYVLTTQVSEITELMYEVDNNLDRLIIRLESL